MLIRCAIFPPSPLLADKAELAKFKFSFTYLSDVYGQHLAQRGLGFLDATPV